MEAVRSVFAHWPQVDFKEIDSGCCGMAGSFGYEKEHYELSMKIGELVLFPAVRKQQQDVIIAAAFNRPGHGSNGSTSRFYDSTRSTLTL